jgi:hypothetical protein
MSQQIETQIDVTLTERNRVSALFRIILVVPMAIFLASFSPSDYSSTDNPNFLAVGFLAMPVALAIIVRQIYPSYLLAFNEALLSLQTRVDAYVLLLTDEYLVKWFLAIPLYVVGLFYILYSLFLTIFAWFSVIFTGKYPEKCAEVVVGTIAYWNRVAGYALLLVTDEYPTFSL